MEQKEIKVCIFEDNKFLRESLSFIIDKADGFSLAGSFPDAKRVIDHIRMTQPDVVLMDIQLPVVSGIEAVLMIKREFPDLKIVMQTVFEDEDSIFKAICNGASGYILKSTPPDRYLDAIREAYNGGAPLTPSIATKVLATFQRQQDMPKCDYEPLTLKEKNVLLCLVNGMSYKMIADHCQISYDTVRFHMKNIYAKLHVASMTEAVAKAIQHRIV